LLPAADVLEARSGVLARQRDVLDQENAVKTQEDALKYLLHFTTPTEVAMSIVPTDSIPMPEVELDEQKSLDLALSRRPDYLATQSALEQNRLQIEAARNGLLPRLDLIASYRRNGSGETFMRNFDTLGSGTAYGWELGLNFIYPLGNRYARNTLEKSHIEYDRARLSREDLEQSIRTNLRATIRDVRVNRQKIDEMALEVEVNRQKLEQEQARFQSHLSTSYLVLTYQNDLATTLNQYNRTIVDYNLSVVKLQQTTGTLLQDLNITIKTGTDAQRQKGTE
jgi:outer membrane protein TolC